jgi:hypothetical protein
MITAAMCFLTGSAGAQSCSPASARLVLAGEYRFRFNNIGGILERADGSLLVTDKTDKQLYALADLGSAPQALGRKGDGPNEVRAPYALPGTRGDTALFADA